MPTPKQLGRMATPRPDSRRRRSPNPLGDAARALTGVASPLLVLAGGGRGRGCWWWRGEGGQQWGWEGGRQRGVGGGWGALFR
ncbi:UNVERIFIED_CONTAM: hypothetical protein Sradi_6500200 [Sesamum radiatum]|uniref:Uncharacterized protein n=1 Tax=Sesamum radiatum TaxID=300843 RepID=A0AAW2JW02_SESRA